MTRPRPEPPDLTGRVTITVDEVAAVLRIGRSAAYDAVHRGEIPHVRIGRRVLVPVARLMTMLGADPTPDRPRFCDQEPLTSVPRERLGS